MCGSREKVRKLKVIKFEWSFPPEAARILLLLYCFLAKARFSQLGKVVAIVLFIFIVAKPFFVALFRHAQSWPVANCWDLSYLMWLLEVSRLFLRSFEGQFLAWLVLGTNFDLDRPITKLLRHRGALVLVLRD